MSDYKKAIEILDEVRNSGLITETDDDALLDQAEFVVCMRKTPARLAEVPPMWRDQIGYAECAYCSADLFYRTNAPANAKKVCMECANDLMEEDDNPEVLTSKAGTEELRAYWKKMGEN